MSISVVNLTYYHKSSVLPALVDINLSLPPGSRTILIGANGGQAMPCFSLERTDIASAGKSTLLHILAGKKLVTAPGAHINVMGRDVFRDFPPGIALLGTEWSVHHYSRQHRVFYSIIFQGNEPPSCVATFQYPPSSILWVVTGTKKDETSCSIFLT